MAIDSKKVKLFWDSRIEKFGKVPLESLTKLEENPELINYKINFEEKRISEFLEIDRDWNILDLGAGVGSWSFWFSDKVKSVVGVEYSEPIKKIFEDRLKELSIKNVTVVHGPAQDYKSDQKFDLIFISGLFVYLNDNEVEDLMKNIELYSHSETVLFIRDGSAVSERFELSSSHSSHLNSTYSAIYRTTPEYEAAAKLAGFTLKKSENMFPEGNSLNKYPETRLRMFYFTK